MSMLAARIGRLQLQGRLVTVIHLVLSGMVGSAARGRSLGVASCRRRLRHVRGQPEFWHRIFPFHGVSSAVERVNRRRDGCRWWAGGARRLGAMVGRHWPGQPPSRRTPFGSARCRRAPSFGIGSKGLDVAPGAAALAAAPPLRVRDGLHDRILLAGVLGLQVLFFRRAAAACCLIRVHEGTGCRRGRERGSGSAGRGAR